VRNLGRYLFCTLIACSVSGLQAQELDKETLHDNGDFTVGAGVGIYRFLGDVGSENERPIAITKGLQLGVEKRFHHHISTGLEFGIGKLRKSERGLTRNLNFESKIWMLQLEGIFHFDNELLMKRTSLIAPYVSAGVAFVKFDPRGDLYDDEGRKYHYWVDGTIQDLPETKENEGLATRLSRDYTYETKLLDSLNNYNRSAFAFPISLGVKLKLWKDLEVRIAGTMYFTTTDNIDNLELGKNDKFIRTTVGLKYTFGVEDAKEGRYEKVDWMGMELEDSDDDGVLDMDDLCANTPYDVKVDITGCPMDSDGDGVPDHEDKEKNTPMHMHVNEFGQAIDDSTFIKIYTARDDSIVEMKKVVRDMHTSDDHE